MHILVLKDEEEKGAFSIINEFGEKIILCFDEEDDATRYSIMLKEMGFNDINIMEYNEDVLIKTCEYVGFKYSKISSHDFVVPPGYTNDNFQKS
jgi:hypothetical protein